MGRPPTAAEDAAWTPHGDGREIILPAAPESEKQALGSILLLPEILDEVASVARPFDFTYTPNRASYQAMLSLRSEGLPITVPMLMDRLRGTKEFSGIDPPTYWLEVVQSVATSVHARTYAKEVVEARRKRERIEGIKTALEKSQNGYTSQEIDDLLFATVDDWRREREAEQPQEQFTLAQLVDKYPNLDEVIVDNICRRGETVNFVGSTKACKSWLMQGLGWSIAAQEPWLGLFSTTKGRVLLIDNELSKSQLAYRVHSVADAMGIPWREHSDDLILRPIRGKRRSIQDELSRVEPGQFDVIICDSKYRFRKPGTQENSNDDQIEFYDIVEEHAERLGAAICFSVHSSKGNQAEKSVTDTGAGGGAQSRAVDSHLVLREHESPGVVVLDAALRSFAPIEPVALRWTFPIWVPALECDPAKLKGKQSRGDERQSDKDREGVNTIVDALRKEEKATARTLREKTGLGKDRQQRLLDWMVSQGHLISNEVNVRGNKCREYELPKDTEN